MKNKSRSGETISIILAIFLIALLVYLGIVLAKGTVRLLGARNEVNMQNMDLPAEETDYPLPPEPEKIERPEYLDQEEQPTEHETLDTYVAQVETTVDKTADELIKEAKTAQ